MTDRPEPGDDAPADEIEFDDEVEPDVSDAWPDDVVIELDEADEVPASPRSALLAAFAPASGQTAEPDPEPDVESEPDPEVRDELEQAPPPAMSAAFTAAAVRPQEGGSGEPPVPPPPADVPRKRPFWRRKSLWAILVVIGAVYVGGYFLTGARLPQNTVVGGVDLGGMSRSAAVTKLDGTLSSRAADPVVLEHDDLTFEITGEDAGLALDAKASVDQAGGTRSWNPARMVGLFVGEHSYDTVLDVDRATLDGVVDSIGEAVDVDVVEAQITFPDAKPRAREPETGRLVPRDDTAELIQRSYLMETGPQKVPTVDVEPAVDSEALQDAMTTIAEPAVSGPVTLDVGDDQVELPVTAYAPALVVRVEKGALTPVIDPEKLAGPLTSSTTGIGEKAVDATVEIQDGKPVVVPGKEGLGLQPEEMAKLLVPVLTETGDKRRVEVEAKVVQPQFTTQDAEALKITEKISEFSTYFPYAEYRNVNQSRAAELIDGIIVKPGETFSFNDTVGERTVANGFTVGTVINGGVFREELGGGVSQVVTTTYNAAFFAGLDDVEHHPHAFYIDRYPVGREATVYFGSLDLRFKNSTDYGVLIKARVKKSTPGSQGETKVEMWSTKVYDIEAGASERHNFRSPGTRYDDTNRCVAQSPIQGFDIDIRRVFKQNGKTVKTETTPVTYQAADTVICGKKPEPKKPKKEEKPESSDGASDSGD